MRRPSINEVAAASGVHRSTVSRAFSHPEAVNPETRAKILQTAKEIGYTMSPLAQALRTSNSNLVPLIIRDITNPFFAELAKAMTKVARDRGYQLLLCETDGDPVQTENYLASMLDLYAPFGVMAPSTKFDREKLSHFEFWNRIVVLDRLDDEGVPTVSVDSARGIELAFEHLSDLGHKRIGYVSGIPGTNTSQDRVREYLRLTGEHLGEPVTLTGGDPTTTWDAVEKFLALPVRPTALIAANDMIAFSIISALHQRGLCVPQEVSVIGFDGLMLGERFNPTLTTVSQPISNMGEIAIDLAQRRAVSGEVNHVVLEPKLLVRQSTARPPQ
jgi:DNA-binding LacI/PurR family transcriptional regulator